jgi:ParB family transcriptional regulator, chromosome partitioning protein
MSLPPGVQHLLADGRLTAGHARALLGTPDRSRQEQLARQAAAENWSVRMLEDTIRDQGESMSKVTQLPTRIPDGAGLTPATRLRAPGLLELEELLAEHLQTKVGVTMGSKRGKVVIDFADLEDLERIYHVISNPPDALA